MDKAIPKKEEPFKAREMPNFEKNSRNLSVSPLRAKQPTQIDKAPVLASEQRS